MKGHIFLLSAALTFASCSAPTYTYHFDTYDYHSGKKLANPPAPATEYQESPLLLGREDPLVSTVPQPATVDAADATVSRIIKRPATESTRYQDLSNSERKVLRKKLRSVINHYAEEIKAGKEGARSLETQQLDDELKLAIIFGAVGITLTVLGGINTIFWVLGIAGLVIGLVFFIRWIQTQ
jgi:hypothetical protein